MTLTIPSGKTPEWGLASLAPSPVWGQRDSHSATEGHNTLHLTFLSVQSKFTLHCIALQRAASLQQRIQEAVTVLKGRVVKQLEALGQVT